MGHCNKHSRPVACEHLVDKVERNLLTFRNWIVLNCMNTFFLWLPQGGFLTSFHVSQEYIYYKHSFLPSHHVSLSIAVKKAGLSTPKSQHSQKPETGSVICIPCDKKLNCHLCFSQWVLSILRVSSHWYLERNVKGLERFSVVMSACCSSRLSSAPGTCLVHNCLSLQGTHHLSGGSVLMWSKSHILY